MSTLNFDASSRVAATDQQLLRTFARSARRFRPGAYCIPVPLVQSHELTFPFFLLK